MQGRVPEARQVLDKLMPSSAEAEKEEALAVRPERSEQQVNLQFCLAEVPSSDFGWPTQSKNIFQKTALPTTLWGCWLQGSQQLTGIDFVLFCKRQVSQA